MGSSRILIATIFAAFAWPANATEQARYEQCLLEAERSPRRALDEATAWQESGGSYRARHCAAAALLRLGQAREAAERLAALARAPHQASAQERAEMLGQASQAWLLAGEAGRAESAASAGLALADDRPILWIDRATARAAANNYAGARADLDEALRRDPRSAEALAFRASANRLLGAIEPAMRDIEAALKLSPAHFDALLERGNIRRIKGDVNGARRDWLEVLRLAPESQAGDAARRNIEAIDVRPPR
jgi:tetratricopeptide (TPR) repeat protein